MGSTQGEFFSASFFLLDACFHDGVHQRQTVFIEAEFHRLQSKRDATGYLVKVNDLISLPLLVVFFPGRSMGCTLILSRMVIAKFFSYSMSGLKAGGFHLNPGGTISNPMKPWCISRIKTKKNRSVFGEELFLFKHYTGGAGSGC